VKVLLKQAHTGHFLKNLDKWTDKAAEARDFRTTPAAMDYSLTHGLQGASIVLTFSEARDELELRNCC